jgi:Carboxypeptidase regulatory-like domain
MSAPRMYRALGALLLCMCALPAYAQQTGAIIGRVSATDGSVLPGVTVEARAAVLPAPRVTVTGGQGEYRLPALPPGEYEVKFELSGMTAVTRQAQVQLALDTTVDATLSIQGVTETVQVTASPGLVDKETATIKSSVTSAQILSLPVGQEYRDLVKLIPGVQYTQDQTRGPSAGGSGQDNVYNFDGVNVTLPLFGTLSAEPSTHDIAQVTTTTSGARAVDFDRAGGFSIDSVSKSGTNRFSGQAEIKLQNDSMAAALESGSLSRYEQDRAWTTLSGGGPILPNRIHFYGSYYRPVRTRDNRANLYGELPKYESTRNEGFGKVTVTPATSLLFNVSYRNSHRIEKSDLFASNASATTGTGSEAWQRIGTADGSWIISPKSYLSFKYTHFANPTRGRPDNIANVAISTAPGTRLDVNSLDTVGLLTVPTLVTGQAAFNTFVQPLIDRYGYIDASGNRIGGGTVGYGTTFDADDFFRDAGQIAWNYTIGGRIVHDIHVGYQRYVDSEDLTRSTNGWGAITVPGGRLSFNNTPIFYTAAFQQQTIGAAPTIHSEYRSQSIEVNDTIRIRNFTFNVGLLASNDTLYGQGLREDSGTLSGYTLAVGSKYKMLNIPFSKMLQPRLGATWAYNGKDTIYGSYARYNPAASSLPRAASWDRNLATTIQAHFDASGVLFATTPVASSSGKLFVDGLTPRSVNEVMVGTARQFNRQWSARLYARYRKGAHFWEDTNNNARVAFNPPADIPRELYIPDLTQQIAQIGSGSTYVIAELDGAFTKYNEATVETEWRGSRAFVRGSYTWSHYYGNMDQDNSTVGNDANIFIGSSNIADGAGRQLWDFKYGDLRGDRPHMLKIYGYYQLPWMASVGAYAIVQAGQPWEAWSYEPYIALTTNTSDTNRYTERAGSRRSPTHKQLDLNYTQDIPLPARLRLQLAADLFNVFNVQTGYNYQPSVHSSVFALPRNYFDPRVLQVVARLRF